MLTLKPWHRKYASEMAVRTAFENDDVFIVDSPHSMFDGHLKCKSDLTEFKRIRIRYGDENQHIWKVEK